VSTTVATELQLTGVPVAFQLQLVLEIPTASVSRSPRCRRRYQFRARRRRIVGLQQLLLLRLLRLVDAGRRKRFAGEALGQSNAAAAAALHRARPTAAANSTTDYF
jgi:hypothetical protein